jgi:membrane-associated PAP2 superfamily phosphatase
MDLPVMLQIGSSSGFPLRNQVLLVGVFHEGWRQFFAAFFVAMVVWAAWPARWNRPHLSAMNLPRRERWALVLLVLLSLLAVNLVKINSLTSCPWDLQLFGGSARYVSHWALGQGDGGSGRCFPGGHASSAFAFLGLCLPWLAPAPDTQRAPAAGLRWLGFLLLAGLTAGAVQTLRGAHFPSHTLWTLLICGSVSWIGWRLAMPGLSQRANPRGHQPR